MRCYLVIMIFFKVTYRKELRNVFLFIQEQGMKQVYDIFTADPVDPEVKKSAVDQLAIMLQGGRHFW